VHKIAYTMCHPQKTSGFKLNPGLDVKLVEIYKESMLGKTMFF